MHQAILAHLSQNGWNIECRKGALITTLGNVSGDRIFYELGRHNIEVATAPSTCACVVDMAQQCLQDVYCAGERIGVYPYHAPIIESDEDLLVIPDERDAVWLELDGREALLPLARTSSVQFTFSVSVQDAARILDRLGAHINVFLEDFPQDAVWKQYIADSSAGYLQTRYGGPLAFESLDEYCRALVLHDVVCGTRLVPFKEALNVNIPLFIRSVWWHFRLKRYVNSLCIEVRPMARREDKKFDQQLENMLNIISA